MRLFRPHIPLEVRCRVAARQLGWKHEEHSAGISMDHLLKHRLIMLGCLLHCAATELHLDHDPPLAARTRKGEGKKTIYDPPANDPDHLIYREKSAHQIKTNVRGDHGQYPDRVLIKRERRRKSGVRVPGGQVKRPARALPIRAPKLEGQNGSGLNNHGRRAGS